MCAVGWRCFQSSALSPPSLLRGQTRIYYGNYFLAYALLDIRRFGFWKNPAVSGRSLSLVSIRDSRPLLSVPAGVKPGFYNRWYLWFLVITPARWYLHRWPPNECPCHSHSTHIDFFVPEKHWVNVENRLLGNSTGKRSGLNNQRWGQWSLWWGRDISFRECLAGF